MSQSPVATAPLAPAPDSMLARVDLRDAGRFALAAGLVASLLAIALYAADHGLARHQAALLAFRAGEAGGQTTFLVWLAAWALNVALRWQGAVGCELAAEDDTLAVVDFDVFAAARVALAVAIALALGGVFVVLPAHWVAVWLSDRVVGTAAGWSEFSGSLAVALLAPGPWAVGGAFGLMLLAGAWYHPVARLTGGLRWTYRHHGARLEVRRFGPAPTIATLTLVGWAVAGAPLLLIVAWWGPAHPLQAGQLVAGVAAGVLALTAGGVLVYNSVARLTGGWRIELRAE